MRASRQRAKERCVFRLEGLEGRSLLSVVAPAGVHAEVRRSGPLPQIPIIQGRLQGEQASDGLMTGTPAGRLSSSGHGSARPVGDVYFGTQHTLTRTQTTARSSTLTLTGGTAVLTTINGDRINFLYEGTGSGRLHGPSTVHLEGIVGGGTGRFEGVRGSFFANGTVQASGRIALNFTTALVYPTRL